MDVYLRRLNREMFDPPDSLAMDQRHGQAMDTINNHFIYNKNQHQEACNKYK